MGGIGFPVELESTETDGYQIREIVVEVHQKKDHPHEYGHYDALVRLSVDVLPGADPVVEIGKLLDLAQEQVQGEIGQWLESIQETQGAEIAPVPYPTTDEAPSRLKTAPGGSGEPLPRGQYPCWPMGSDDEAEEIEAFFAKPATERQGTASAE